MKTAFIFHGTSDTPLSHWFPALKIHLEKKWYTVYCPQFPGIEEESYTSWLQIIHPYMHSISEETIFIWHSLGACFILQLLSSENISIAQAFLVGWWGEKLSDEIIHNHYKLFCEWGFKENKSTLYNYETFVEDLEFSTIRKHCPSFTVFSSANDPYIPIEISRNLALNLDWALYEYPHAGHFCKRDGFERFEDLENSIA